MTWMELFEQYEASAEHLESRIAELRKVLKDSSLSRIERSLLHKRIHILEEMAKDSRAISQYIKELHYDAC